MKPTAALAAAAVLLTALAVGATARAQEGGEAFRRAPAFAPKTWVQGQKTALDGAESLYVVELWATWCGPCRTSLPELAALQREHAGKLTTVALTNDDLGAVRRFVAGRKEAMAPLAVAVDDEVYDAFSEAFDVDAIPRAFLIKGGRVLWTGHPAGLELILERVLAGRWTPRSEAEMRAWEQKADAVEAHWRGGGTMTEKAQEAARALLKDAADNPMAANGVAWTWLTRGEPGKRPLKLALAMAEAANAGTKGENHAILDTYARALYLTGDKGQAVTLQKKALALCQASPGGRCGDLKKVLKVYEEGGALP